MKLLLDDKATRGYDLDARGWRSMRIDALWSYQRALKLTE